MFENIATPALNIAAPSGFVHKCEICRDPIKPEGRADLLKSQDRPLLCLWCGEQMSRVERSSWCIAPISNKTGYTRVTDYSLLKQINPKRTEA